MTDWQRVNYFRRSVEECALLRSLKLIQVSLWLWYREREELRNPKPVATQQQFGADLLLTSTICVTLTQGPDLHLPGRRACMTTQIAGFLVK